MKSRMENWSMTTSTKQPENRLFYLNLIQNLQGVILRISSSRATTLRSRFCSVRKTAPFRAFLTNLSLNYYFFSFYLSAPKVARATRLWDKRNDIVSKYKGNVSRGNGVYAFSSTLNRVQVLLLKAENIGGRNQSIWVSTLYLDFLSNFERLRSLGVKFNM